MKRWNCDGLIRGKTGSVPGGGGILRSHERFRFSLHGEIRGRMPESAKSYAKGFLGAGLIPEWPDVYAIFFVTWVLIQENDADLHLFDLHHKPSFE